MHSSPPVCRGSSAGAEPKDSTSEARIAAVANVRVRQLLQLLYEHLGSAEEAGALVRAFGALPLNSPPLDQVDRAFMRQSVVLSLRRDPFESNARRLADLH